MMGLIFLFLGLLGCLVIAAANRYRRPDYSDLEQSGPRDLPLARDHLSVLTWNLGYGALGREANLFVDGGQALRALPKAEITRATEQIAAQLAQGSHDVLCLQENALPGFLTRKVDLKGRIEAALADRQQGFWADMKTVLMPPPLRIAHGMSSFFARQVQDAHVVALPGAYTLMAGVLKKCYVALVHRLPIAGTDRFWVVFNIHLPAFKTSQAARLAQLSHLFEAARQEYARGNHVIIAGDWNTRICLREFPHHTGPEHLFWLTDLPAEILPPGWQIIADRATPSVRTMHEPYRPGQTYVSIIDGYCVSPNVHPETVKTHDLGFAVTDHHPVEARFRAVLSDEF